jgi:hypothetical protein
MLVILGAIIRLLLLTEIVLPYTERIIQSTKSSRNFKFDTVINDSNNSNPWRYL